MINDTANPIFFSNRLRNIRILLYMAMTLLLIIMVGLIVKSYLSADYALRLNYPKLRVVHRIETELLSFKYESDVRNSAAAGSEARLDRCLRALDSLEAAGYLKPVIVHGFALDHSNENTTELLRLRSALRSLKKSWREYRNSSFFSSGEVETKYHSDYSLTLQSALRCRLALESLMAGSSAGASRSFHLILLCAALMLLSLSFILVLYNRQRRNDAQSIQAAVQQISAGEQQLIASNQQLRALNQQLTLSDLKLRESESQFRLLSEQSLLGIMIIQDNVLRYANQGLANISEYPVEEMLTWPARDFAKIMHPEDRPRIMDYSDRKQTGDTAVPLSNTLRLITRSGRIKWIDSYSKAVLFQGRIAVIYSIADITDRMKKAEEIERLNQELDEGIKRRTQQLETANRELESFSYSVSHDLRAPLRSINGFSQALLEDCESMLPDSGREYIRRLRSASDHMGRLIDDFLKLSRITRTEMRYESVDLSALVRELAAELKKEAGAREIRFVIAEGVQATGDASLLRTVLGNLLQNSLKYTSRHPRACIEFGTVQHEGGRAYFVRDDGAGFDMTYAGKLFGPFQRLHTAGEFEGTGIGLATVQRIIHRHGGRIWAESEVEKGATFYFNL